MQVSAKVIDEARYDAFLSIISDIPPRMAHPTRTLTAYFLPASADLTASVGHVVAAFSVGDTHLTLADDDFDSGVDTVVADSNEASARVERDLCLC